MRTPLSYTGSIARAPHSSKHWTARPYLALPHCLSLLGCLVLAACDSRSARPEAMVTATSESEPGSEPELATLAPDAGGAARRDAALNSDEGMVREPYPSSANGEASDVLSHSPVVACGEATSSDTDADRPSPPAPLRLATWNIRAARSAPLEEIEAELTQMQADIIALQEVDVGVRRTGLVDQPLALANALGTAYAFAASIKWDGGDFGLALLSRWPLVSVTRHRLDSDGATELRIALDVSVCVAGLPLRVFNHHADIRGEPRQSALAELANLVEPSVGERLVVMGDFNDAVDAPGLVELLDTGLVDVFADLQSNTAAPGRIDYLLVDPPLFRAVSPQPLWTTSSSDHHALLADVDWDSVPP